MRIRTPKQRDARPAQWQRDVNTALRQVNNLFVGSGESEDRPDPAAMEIGAMFFDTTLGHPIYSDGLLWVDALGGPV